MNTATPASSPAARATVIVREHAALAMASSLVPVPFIEFAALSAVHHNLIEALAREYGVDFRPDRARALVAAIASGYASRYMGTLLAGNLARFFPGLGSLIALVAFPSAAGSLTYALGRVFVRHFELGGSLLDFDFSRAQPGLLQEVERIRVDRAELARVIGAAPTAGQGGSAPHS